MVTMRVTALISLLYLFIPAQVVAEDDALYMAQLVGRGFFRALQDGEVEAMVPLCAEAVNFDGELVKGRPKVKARLARLVKRARKNHLRLKKVLLLSYREAIKVLGPCPERLKKVLKPGHMVALAAFQRGGAVAVLARRGDFWRVIALTD